MKLLAVGNGGWLSRFLLAATLSRIYLVWSTYNLIGWHRCIVVNIVDTRQLRTINLVAEHRELLSGAVLLQVFVATGMAYWYIISLLLPWMLMFATILTWPASRLPAVVFLDSFTFTRLLREFTALWKWSFWAPTHSPSILVILSWLDAPMSWSVPFLIPVPLYWPRSLSLVALPWNLLNWRWSQVIAFSGTSSISHCISWRAFAIIVVLRWIPSHLLWSFLFRWISLCAVHFTSPLTLTTSLMSTWTRCWLTITLSSFPSTHRWVFRCRICQGKLLPGCFLLQG